MVLRNHTVRWKLLTISGAALGATACWVPKETGRIMQDDIAALKADLTQVHKAVDEERAVELEHRQQTLKKFEEISGALAEFNRSARMTDADFGSQMDRIIHDVQDLRGAVEVNEHRIGETETKIEQSLAQRIDALNKQIAGGGTETSETADKGMPKDKKEALAFAAKLAKDGKTNDARAAYRNILRDWPKDPGTTDEAMYRLGESYYDEKKFDAALREYIKVVDKFATGDLVDDSYYKIGMCSLELNRLDDAQTFFNEIVNNHKKSPLVKSARARLEEVSKRQEQTKKKPSKKK